jgi:hypothetical protein
MNGVDYSKQLAKDREYYQDALKKTKDAHEQRLSATIDRNDHVQKKQRENFIEDKAELESSQQKHIAELQDKTREAIEVRKEKYQKELAKERENFSKESTYSKKDFDQRLNDIKSSYQKSFKAEKDLHNDVQTSDRKRYSKNINEIQENSEEKLKSYQDKLTGAGSSVKDQYKREREQLVRAHEDHSTLMQRDSAKKREELKERIANDLKRTKEVQDADLHHAREYSQDRLKTIQNRYQERFDGMTQDHSRRSEELVETQQKDANKTNREHQEQVHNIRRDFNKEMRMVELEKRRRDNGSGDFAQVMSKQQGLNEKGIQEAKIDRLKDQIVDAQRVYQERASDEQNVFNETLKSQNMEAAARQERKLNEVNADKLSTVAHEREKAFLQIDNREQINKADKVSSEQQLILERANAKHRMNKLKENFNQSMKAMEERQKLTLEDVTKSTNNDKAEFMKKMNENRANEIFGMKREFSKLMDSTVNEYEQRLANFQRENEYLKLTMDQKVQNITDQTEKQLESQRQMFEDRKAADIKGQQLLMDQRESQLKSDMNHMSVSFQKKIDKMQITSETKLKLLTNDYENKLKELRATTSRDLAQKDMNHQIEQERLKQAYEAEKNRVVASYENQIQSMKTGHREQMESLKEYKRLS